MVSDIAAKNERTIAMNVAVLILSLSMTRTSRAVMKGESAQKASVTASGRLSIMRLMKI